MVEYRPDSGTPTPAPVNAGLSELQAQLLSWFSHHPWEIMATLTTPRDSISPEAFCKQVYKWRIRLQAETCLQIASMGLLVYKPRPHVHMLLLGRNRHGETLQTRLTSALTQMHRDGKIIPAYCGPHDRHWPHECLLQPIYDLQGVVSYLAISNARPGECEPLIPYNQRLLEKTKLIEMEV